MREWFDLKRLNAEVDAEALAHIRKLKNTELARYAEYQSVLDDLPDVQPSRVVIHEDVVKIGRVSDLKSEQQSAQIQSAIESFVPWKKGPFELFGQSIDAEWNSSLKWQRLRPYLPPLKDKVVADIGCHNGYFMFRMLEQNPGLVVGIEPYLKHLFSFDMFQKYIQRPELVFEPCGVEHMPYFGRSFDVVFCMGILYHHTDPVGLCRKIWHSMKPKATLVVDCQGIPGEQPVALVPERRYANAKGVWFLPTESCLHNWLRRAQFSDIKTVFSHQLEVDEQRTTKHAPIPSLAEALDPKDDSLTVEGYPRPRRMYVIARRG